VALVRHLLITQDYPPMGGGMARRHVELARRLDSDAVTVSTVAADPPHAAAAAAFDGGESYEIVRQPFPFRGAKTVFNQARWARWLAPRADRRRGDAVDVVHCGNVRPAGYPTWWVHRSTGVPYLLYVYGGDLLRERRKLAAALPQRLLKRWTARRIFEDSAGVVAISDWSAELCRAIMGQAGVERTPPILINPLGTDPQYFRPSRDAGTLRRRLGIGDAPLLLTVARLVPHKGIDVALEAVAALGADYPQLRYLVVGQGDDAVRLTQRAATLGITDRVVFAGSLSDEDIAEAYATADVYVGLSRVDSEINAEGFGIAFVEAAASGIPAVAGDSGGVRSAVRDGETGVVVDPIDARAAAAAIGGLLGNPGRRRAMGAAGRRAAEQYFNWERVARDVREFAASAVAHSGAGRAPPARRVS
jgi:phosphatidylinositol alpha-1,6-mannosyltransferase